MECTFTALQGDFGKGVVAAVALPPYDSGFAGTLPCLHVTGARVGAQGEAVAGIAGVTALWPVVIRLEKQKRTDNEVFYLYPKYKHLLVFLKCWSSTCFIKGLTEPSTG